VKWELVHGQWILSRGRMRLAVVQWHGTERLWVWKTIGGEGNRLDSLEAAKQAAELSLGATV